MMFISKKFIPKTIILCLTILGLFTNTSIQAEIKSKTPIASESKSEFQYIPQPLWRKSLITASCLGLIGLETWWFLLSKSKAKKQ